MNAIGMFTISISCVLHRCKQQIERTLEFRERDAIGGVARSVSGVIVIRHHHAAMSLMTTSAHAPAT